jgi:hypothetical protein
MPDFWPDSGLDLCTRNATGRLMPTDALLRAWWLRPEVAPVAESCDAERALHAALLDAPRRPVGVQELAAIQDPDARENYEVLLDWRERLLSATTLESAYLNLFRGGPVTVPPLFIDQLARMIVHGMLEGTDDALQVRAAELFFRRQKVTLHEGRVLLADAETIERHETGGNYGNLGRLLAEARISRRKVDLDVLDRANADSYWARSEAHDMVIGFHHDGAALAGFCRVIEKWVRHFFGVEVTVDPMTKIEDPQWAWHIGLDAEATAILNDLYRGKEPGPERNRRILSLFRMDFADPAVMRPDIAGRPVYLACAMDAGHMLRIKPQNLLLNLPLATLS